MRETRKLKKNTKLEVQVLDYVNQKAEEAELNRQKTTIDKKLEITQVAWKRAKMSAQKAGLVVE